MKKQIAATDLHRKWTRGDTAHRQEFAALEGEFSLASAMIEARALARLTLQQLAKRMRTSQAVIARLESGRAMPSTRTLERTAAATGMRLRITLEPLKAA